MEGEYKQYEEHGGSKVQFNLRTMCVAIAFVAVFVVIARSVDRPTAITIGRSLIDAIVAYSPTSVKRTYLGAVLAGTYPFVIEPEYRGCLSESRFAIPEFFIALPSAAAWHLARTILGVVS